jgi:hypothetical protein
VLASWCADSKRVDEIVFASWCADSEKSEDATVFASWCANCEIVRMGLCLRAIALKAKE